MKDGTRGRAVAALQFVEQRRDAPRARRVLARAPQRVAPVLEDALEDAAAEGVRRERAALPRERDEHHVAQRREVLEAARLGALRPPARLPRRARRDLDALLDDVVACARRGGDRRSNVAEIFDGDVPGNAKAGVGCPSAGPSPFWSWTHRRTAPSNSETSAAASAGDSVSSAFWTTRQP